MLQLPFAGPPASLSTVQEAPHTSCFSPWFQADPGALLVQAWNPVLEAGDFPSDVPEDAGLTAEQWAEYIAYNIGKECPAPKAGEEDRIRAKGWPSWRAYHALKRLAEW